MDSSTKKVLAAIHNELQSHAQVIKCLLLPPHDTDIQDLVAETMTDLIIKTYQVGYMDGARKASQAL